MYVGIVVYFSWCQTGAWDNYLFVVGLEMLTACEWRYKDLHAQLKIQPLRQWVRYEAYSQSNQVGHFDYIRKAYKTLYFHSLCMG